MPNIILMVGTLHHIVYYSCKHNKEEKEWPLDSNGEKNNLFTGLPSTNHTTDLSRLRMLVELLECSSGFSVAGGSVVTGQSPIVVKCHEGTAILCGAWLWADSRKAM